jgi:hypothetical protein
LCLLRDFKHGKSVGCSDVYASTKKAVVLTSEVANNDTDTPEHMKGKWAALTQGTTSVVVTKDGDHETLTLKAQGYAKHGDEDSWDDLLPHLNMGSDGSHEAPSSPNVTDGCATKKLKKHRRKKIKGAKGARRVVLKKSTIAKAIKKVPPQPSQSKSHGENKVFPSVQLRSIINVEIIVGEIQAVLKTVSDYEGLQSLTMQKVRCVWGLHNNN